jgi:hypothetical protein
MSTQNANAVAITGGTATLTSVTTPTVQATNSAGLALKNSAGTTQISMGAGGGDNITVSVPIAINPANGLVNISPTGTGTVTINPATAGTINNTSIGATSATTGKFSTLEATGNSTLGTGSSQYIQVEGGATAVLLSAQGAGANIPLALQPKGTGALQAQATTSTTVGGNARGANAVDWQTNRSNAANVASGSYSFIGSGQDNRASATWGSVVSGSNNINTGAGAIIAGGVFNSITSAAYSFIGAGSVNTISNSAIQPSSFIGAGFTNTANGYLNFVGGGSTNSGTSGSAVTTQSGTMNATTAVTLSGSNANIKVGQFITGTSIGGDTYVAAISGTALTLSKVASGSSTSTLSFFTPHGVVVGGGNNQATGSYSFIGGGGDAGTAANRNVASGDWSFVGGGQKNTASGIGSFIGGGGTFGSGTSANTASGISAFIGAGFGNQSLGLASVIAGGNTNYSNGTYSAIIGGAFGTARGISGYHVFPACNSPIAQSYGVSQGGLLVLAVQTTDATATALRSDGGGAGSSNQVILPNNSAYFFTGEVISGVTGGGDAKGWTIEGVIKRGANAGTTTIVGVTVMSSYADLGAATWTIAVTADTTNGGLRVTFTGQAATTIRTVCQIRTTEMTY